MGGWKSGRGEEWGGWKSGRVEEWKSGRVEEWKSGRVGRVEGWILDVWIGFLNLSESGFPG